MSEDRNESRLNDIEARLRTIENFIAADKVASEAVVARLGKIEDTLTWLVRLIIGAIILAFITFALGGGITGG